MMTNKPLPRRRSSRALLALLAAGSTFFYSTPAFAQLNLNAPVRSPGIQQENSLATDLTSPFPKEAKAVRQHEFAQALAHQVPVMNRLMEWRSTVRGTGPQQEWQMFSSSDTPLKLQIGKQQLPGHALLGASGTASAIGAQWGRFSAGSTAPMLSLNQALRGVDEVLEEKPKVSYDESHLTWISAQAVQSQRAELNLLMARGQRDLDPKKETNKRIVDGDWMGASGKFSLTSDWKLAGEYMHSSLQDGASAHSWQMDLGGPISHPWGVARFDASYKDREAGFAAWRDGREQFGFVERNMSLRQDLNFGNLRGSTQLALQQHLWPVDPNTGGASQAALAGSSDPSNTLLESVARLRWQVSPAVSLSGSHIHRTAKRDLPELVYRNNEDWDGGGVKAARTETEATAEVKLSSALALQAVAALTRADGDVQWEKKDPYRPFDLRDEDRISLGLRHRTKVGTWQLQFVRSETADPFTDYQSEVETLRIEAERQLFSWLRLKGRFDRDTEWNTERQADFDQWRRQAEANLSLSDYGQLSLRYGDHLRHDGALEIGTETNMGEYGVRYQVGQGAGLNLSIEYSRREQANKSDDDLWRIGLTYR